MIKNTPIILDRLSSALAAQGVSLKRQQLLKVAAAAFGFRDGNAFSAADTQGDLAVPAATTIGIDDQGLAVLNDPVARRIFAIDLSHPASRADRWTVSPYGNLLDIGGLPASNPTNHADVTIHIGMVSHRHGNNFYTATTAQGIEAEIAGYCEEWWDEARALDSDLPETIEGMSNEQVIEAYFGAVEAEYYETGTDTLRAAPTVAARLATHTGRAWVIRLRRDDVPEDGGATWWNNEQGWGDLANATVFADTKGDLPMGEGDSVEWLRLPEDAVERSKESPSRIWVSEDHDGLDAVAAIMAVEGIEAHPGVRFNIANMQRDGDGARRVVLQTGGAYDPEAALAWRLLVHADLRAAGAEIELSPKGARVVFEGYGYLNEAAGPRAWMAAMSDILRPLDGRERIIADFRPEAWINDHAVEVDTEDANEIDVTFEMLLMGHEAAMELDSADSDHLIEAVRAPRWIRQWPGPFTIDVHDAVEKSGLFV